MIATSTKAALVSTASAEIIAGCRLIHRVGGLKGGWIDTGKREGRQTSNGIYSQNT